MKGFEDALAFTLRWEGGRVDDKDDRGGRTAFGITQRTFDAWLAKSGLGSADVWDIEPNEVEEIYRNNYWSAAGCDLLPWPLSLVIFDSAVNSGVSRAKKWLAEARKLAPDAEAAPTVIGLRRMYLRSLGQEKFLKGWMNRLDALATAAGAT